jgi:hypothetical protein
MSGYECIRIAFRRLGKARNAAKLAQMRKIRLASRQQLMDIRLVTYIKYQAIFIGVKYGFNGNRQLYNSQIGGQMPTGFGKALHEKFPDFLTQDSPFLFSQPKKVGMAQDGF